MIVDVPEILHHHEVNSVDEDNDGDPTLAKAVAMVVLFCASMLLGSLPIQLNKWLKWESDAKDNEYVKILLGLGGGVLLCTTFIHLLPEVSESFEDLDLTPDVEIPYAELLMCIGFFTMYFVEECVHLYIENRERDRDSVLRKSLSIRRGEFEFKPPTKDLHHHHHHQDHEQGGHSHMVIDNSDGDATLKMLRGLLIVLALSVHELFEGLAVGLESSTMAVWYMFGAVSAHKLVIAFCIGVELVTSRMKSMLIVIYVFTFAVVSPMGIGIGIGITRSNETDTEVVSVVLQGLATGTLLYVVFFEILQTDKKKGLKQFGAVLVGFVLMFGLTLMG